MPSGIRPGREATLPLLPETSVWMSISSSSFADLFLVLFLVTVKTATHAFTIAAVLFYPGRELKN